ncbi:serine/threonine protein kinase [archaeon SCG-AAA382B04]|nr:serine/threonine protein kinase [archaeon SCG-AAA382B04]
MLDKVVENFKSIEDKGFKVLRGIETGMKTYHWVPIDEVSTFSGLPLEEVRYRLDRLDKFELIEGKKIGNKRFKLNFNGYDALALNVFANRDSIDSIGGEVGFGKEAEVRKAKWKGNEVIVKFHREGKVSFRKIKKERDYLGDRKHFSSMLIAKLAAKREYEVLDELSSDVRVPEPFDWNRHSIVMENIEGDELANVTLNEEDANFIFDILVDEIKKTYSLGFIHGDMSEFNILISENQVKIIDWSQSVNLDHPNSQSFLKRDVENLCSYFNRKYQLGINIKDCLEKIRS